MGNVERGETMTMAPFVVGKKVLVGDSGGEMGVWGWIAALDVDSGKELWRAYSTGSDQQVRIGTDFKPFYDRMKGKDLGIKHVARGTCGSTAPGRSGVGSPTTRN
jgi:glucose dehydrogenase